MTLLFVSTRYLIPPREAGPQTVSRWREITASVLCFLQPNNTNKQILRSKVSKVEDLCKDTIRLLIDDVGDWIRFTPSVHEGINLNVHMPPLSFTLCTVHAVQNHDLFKAINSTHNHIDLVVLDTIAI